MESGLVRPLGSPRRKRLPSSENLFPARISSDRKVSLARNHARRFEGILKMKSQAFEAPDPESLQSKSPFARKIESPIKALRVLRGRLSGGSTHPSVPCSCPHNGLIAL